MANTSSAKKAIRKIARRTNVNGIRRARVRTFWRKVEEAIRSGDPLLAKTALQAAERETMRAVTKGVIPKNTGSRKVSRLAQRVRVISIDTTTQVS